jgi:hypothetical protein
VPTIAKANPLVSVPETEKTYVPFSKLLLKPPLGGATGVVTLPPLPPQAAKKMMAESAKRRAIALRTDITSPWEIRAQTYCLMRD